MKTSIHGNRALTDRFDISFLFTKISSVKEVFKDGHVHSHYF